LQASVMANVWDTRGRAYIASWVHIEVNIFVELCIQIYMSNFIHIHSGKYIV
jgi:hypothetical protein